MKGAITNADYQNLLQLTLDIQDNSSAIHGRIANCPTDYDPFEGQKTDLLQGFIDAGLGGLIAEDCYDSPKSRFDQGFLDPVPNVSTYAGGDAGSCTTACGTPTPPVPCDPCITLFASSCSCPGGTCGDPTVVTTICGGDITDANTWIQNPSNKCNWTYKNVDFSKCCTTVGDCATPDSPGKPTVQCCWHIWEASWSAGTSSWTKTCIDSGCGTDFTGYDWLPISEKGGTCYTTTKVISTTCCASASECSCGPATAPPDPTAPCDNCYIKWSSNYNCDSTGWTEPTSSSLQCGGSPYPTEKWSVTPGTNSCTAYIWEKLTRLCSGSTMPCPSSVIPSSHAKPGDTCACSKCYTLYNAVYDCDYEVWRYDAGTNSCLGTPPTPLGSWSTPVPGTRTCTSTQWALSTPSECISSSGCTAKGAYVGVPGVCNSCGACQTDWTVHYTCGSGFGTATSTQSCVDSCAASGFVFAGQSGDICTYTAVSCPGKACNTGSQCVAGAAPALPSGSDCVCKDCLFTFESTYSCTSKTFGAISHGTASCLDPAACTAGAYGWSYVSYSAGSNSCLFRTAICSATRCSSDGGCAAAWPADPSPATTPTGCPCATGACCSAVDGHTCTNNLTPAQCAALVNGSFQGADTTCNTDPCGDCTTRGPTYVGYACGGITYSHISCRILAVTITKCDYTGFQGYNVVFYDVNGNTLNGCTFIDYNVDQCNPGPYGEARTCTAVGVATSVYVGSSDCFYTNNGYLTYTLAPRA